MKRMILMGLALVLTAGATHAQKSNSKATNDKTRSSATTKKTKKGNSAKTKKDSSANSKTAKQQKPAKLNHRKIYHWETGQRATPTGQEATGVGSGYSAIKKDTAGKKDDQQLRSPQ